ncbi:MAG: TOBE domain-containing protein, partial [Microcystaceae cyanobacterium]
VKRITHLGWEIQVELILPDQEMVIAHLSREQFSSLDLKIDQQVFIKPRQTKVFSAEKGFLNFAI